MEKKDMLQILVPAGAAAAVVLLIGALIAMSDWSTPETDKSKGGQTSSPAGGVKGQSVDGADKNDKGMSDSMPDINAAEWKLEPNGMKMWDVVVGTGEPCPSGASVTIHYTGWTTDGKQFDGSRGRGSPTAFELGSLIKGWQYGIPGMKPGGIRRLSIPGELGYGSRGSPPKIPGNATLIFEVKLLGYN